MLLITLRSLTGLDKNYLSPESFFKESNLVINRYFSTKRSLLKKKKLVIFL